MSPKRPETSWTEEELEREVNRLTMKVAKVLGGCGPGVYGSVVSNLLAMYLWTFAPESRERVIAHHLKLVRRLLDQVNTPQAPPEVRQDPDAGR